MTHKEEANDFWPALESIYLAQLTKSLNAEYKSFSLKSWIDSLSKLSFAHILLFRQLY